LVVVAGFRSDESLAGINLPDPIPAGLPNSGLLSAKLALGLDAEYLAGDDDSSGSSPIAFSAIKESESK
jgi:hypothetical protein